MSVIRFVNEIFNGYLPTELTTQYPEGVVIVVSGHDHAHVHSSVPSGFERHMSQ